MTKRFRWILVGLIIGLVTGGVAYAVVVNPPNSSDRYYACVSNVGIVKAGTVRLNAPPTRCPAATDQIHSWNAAGSTGPTGVAGESGAPGATGATGTAGADGAPGGGYLAYVGVYSATFTNEGCETHQIRLKVIPRFGAPVPASPLGPCTTPVMQSGNDYANLTTYEATNSVRYIAYQVPNDYVDRFGFRGFGRSLTWGGGPQSYAWYCVGAPAPIINSGGSCPSSHPVTVFDAGFYTGTMYSDSDITYSGVVPSYQLTALVTVPAGTPIPNASTFVWPTADQLPAWEIFRVPA